MRISSTAAKELKQLKHVWQVVGLLPVYASKMYKDGTRMLAVPSTETSASVYFSMTTVTVSTSSGTVTVHCDDATRSAVAGVCDDERERCHLVDG